MSGGTPLWRSAGIRVLAHAEVFWQGQQSQLLVTDNQTRQYDVSSPAVRDALAHYAWEPRARPG